MKIQIVFLSLLAAAHARHEPKGLRGGGGGGGGDEHDLELVGFTVVPKGSSATVHCGSGSQCCVTVTGRFGMKLNTGNQQFHFGGSCKETLSNGSLILSNCQEQEPSSCSVSCDGNCNVVVTAGSGSAGAGLPGRGGSTRGYGSGGHGM
jgi:hypothetical protein